MVFNKLEAGSSDARFCFKKTCGMRHALVREPPHLRERREADGNVLRELPLAEAPPRSPGNLMHPPALQGDLRIPQICNFPELSWE